MAVTAPVVLEAHVQALRAVVEALGERLERASDKREETQERDREALADLRTSLALLADRVERFEALPARVATLEAMRERGRGFLLAAAAGAGTIGAGLAAGLQAVLGG